MCTLMVHFERYLADRESLSLKVTLTGVQYLLSVFDETILNEHAAATRVTRVSDVLHVQDGTKLPQHAKRGKVAHIFRKSLHNEENGAGALLIMPVLLNPNSSEENIEFCTFYQQRNNDHKGCNFAKRNLPWS